MFNLWSEEKKSPQIFNKKILFFIKTVNFLNIFSVVWVLGVIFGVVGYYAEISPNFFIVAVIISALVLVVPIINLTLLLSKKYVITKFKKYFFLVRYV